MKAKTFDLETGEDIIVEIVSGPTSTGLYIVKTNEGKKLSRHKNRIEMIDEKR